MKILFLTDEFYPTLGANSLVVRALAEELVKREHKVFVMPFSYGDDLPTPELWQGIQIVRAVPNDDKRALLEHVKKGKLFTAARIALKHVKVKCARKEKILHKDRIAARRVLERFIKENQIDTVISICCSIELSFPLLYLRKRSKLPCKWLFYMIDPFESHSYYRGIEKVSVLRKLQHEIMKRCDRVVMTDLIYKDTKTWETEEILKKASVVEFPKIEKPIPMPCEDDVSLDGDRINIVCTGSKNEAVRSSAYTFQLVEGLKDEPVLFHFIGYGWCESEREVKGNCVFYKPRSYRAVRNLQMNADFLLNIGNAVVNQLPSKVLEYISTGKPIINVAKSEACPTIPLLESADAITVWEKEEPEASVRRLKDFLSTKHEAQSFGDIEKKYETYTPKYVAEQLLSM